MIFLRLGEVAEGALGTIEVAVRSLCFSISSFLYQLMIGLYNIFELLCTSRLLENDVLSMISSRIGLILGIVMFFYIAFAFVKMLIDPDAISSKDTGALAIIKKTLIVIVMFGSFNFVFDFLYQAQKFIVENHIISNFILPYQIEDDDLDNFGSTLAYQLMFSFYVDNDFDDVSTEISQEERDIIQSCQSITSAFKNQVMIEGKFDLGYTCLDQFVSIEDSYSGNEVDIFVINYNYIFSVLVAVFVDYILFMYCFKVGIRMIQLMVLEVLSPVAILSYLAPKKDTMFSKWLKLYSATYIDVFIRIGIINFVIFLMATIFHVEKNMDFGFWGTIATNDSGTLVIIEVIMILALLTFAKKAPDLIKELFSAGASKLGFGLSMKDIVGLQKGAKIGSSILGGAVGGAAMGAVGLLSGRGLGFATGALKGGLGGLKGQGFGKSLASAWKDQSKMNKTIADVRANGGTAMGYHMAQLQKQFGLSTEADAFNQEKANLEAENAVYKSYDSYIDAAEKRAEGQILKGVFNNEHANKTLRLQKMAEVYTQQAANLDKNDFFDKVKYRNDLVELAADNGIRAENYRYAKDYEKALSDFDVSTANTLNKNDYIDVDAYEKKKDEYVTLSKDASAEALREMKSAKKDYITEQLRIAREEGVENADAPTIQALQEAAGILDAYVDNTDYDFTYETKDENGNVIETGRLTGEGLLAGDYDKLDSANNHMKAKQTRNINRIVENQTEGAAARANKGN